MFADRLEEFRAAERVKTGVQLLAHEDTALKAYFQTRPRYLAGLPQRRMFNWISEALRHGWTPHPVRLSLASDDSPFFVKPPGGAVTGC